ncbi:MAG: SocA family protein [Dehalococcoidia bacterium]|nr:SocA family protein [Dehalococcoidia bacterium]
MTVIAFRFDRTKAIEAILYLAHRISDSDIYGICKLLYLVDKTSLEKYGRFVFGESYSAMKEGATPSNAYDLLKEAARAPVNGLSVEGNQVVALREADLDCLSDSDIECLDRIIGIYGNTPNWQRAREAHDDAYQKAWNARGNRQSARMSVESIAELLADADHLLDYLSNRDAE